MIPALCLFVCLSFVTWVPTRRQQKQGHIRVLPPATRVLRIAVGVVVLVMVVWLERLHLHILLPDYLSKPPIMLRRLSSSFFVCVCVFAFVALVLMDTVAVSTAFLPDRAEEEGRSGRKPKPTDHAVVTTTLGIIHQNRNGILHRCMGETLGSIGSGRA